MSNDQHEAVFEAEKLAALGTEAVREAIAEHLANGHWVWIEDGRGSGRRIYPDDPEAKQYLQYLKPPAQAAE